MSTLLPLFLLWTFDTFISASEAETVNRVEASVFSGNAGSMRVLQKCGFREEGVLRGKVWKEGKMLDLHVWGLLREEFEFEAEVEIAETEVGP